MKLGLIGDIHGNDLALEAVLNAAQKKDVDILLVTGDLVGYYFSPSKVLELLGNWERFIVRGNHEEMLTASRLDDRYLQVIENRYGNGVLVALQELDDEQLDYLCNLPHPLELNLDGIRILLCHGAPWDVNQYIYPDAETELMDRCASYDFDVVVTGHTHYPMFKMAGNTIVVNPGSVGQPRDRKPGACWALFDTDDRSILFQRESYDSSSLVRECKLRHPELPYLAEVLVRNN